MSLDATADHEWTKEETDYLFDVVREYDARWYIITDRYDYPGGQPRTMEVINSVKLSFLSVD